MSTDKEWEAWGKKDPYYGVLTAERYRRDTMDEAAYKEFFQSGEDDIEQTLADCSRHFGEVPMRRTLDFGCGVGRLLLPLAKRTKKLCVGIDISDSMLAETARNAAKFGQPNLHLCRSIEDARSAKESFGFVHSYIVFQHIDPRRGLRIIAQLLALLEKGGVAALHVTYGRRKYLESFGAKPTIRRAVEHLVRRPLSRLAHRLQKKDPEMQMNTYDLNKVLFLAQQSGVRLGGIRFTDHGGHLGACLFLKRD